MNNYLTKKFSEGTRIIIHSFGDDKQHSGTIRGISFGTIRGISFDYFPITVVYIVEIDPLSPWEHNGYSCITVPSACLTEIF